MTREQPVQCTRRRFLGGAAAAVCLAIAQSNGSRLMYALAYSGFFLNLFNMLPFGIFRARQFTSANVVTFAVYGALGGALFLLPIQLQQVRGQANELGAGPVVRHVADFLEFLALQGLFLAPHESWRCVLSKGIKSLRGFASVTLP